MRREIALGVNIRAALSGLNANLGSFFTVAEGVEDCGRGVVDAVGLEVVVEGLDWDDDG